MRYRVPCLLITLLAVPILSHAGWDPLDQSFAEIVYDGAENLTLLVVPDGTGASFTAASLPSGQSADATITLHLRDINNVPVVGYPAEDLWLATDEPGLLRCPSGTTAASNSDAAGIVTWTTPLRAGGAGQTGCRIVANGAVLSQIAPLPLHFNSPDLNGDLRVNLLDVAVFSADFFGTFKFRSDLQRDGVINLKDLIVMAHALGRQCP